MSYLNDDDDDDDSLSRVLPGLVTFVTGSLHRTSICTYAALPCYIFMLFAAAVAAAARRFLVH